MLKKKFGILSLSDHSLDTTSIDDSRSSFAVNEIGKDESIQFINNLKFDDNITLYAKSFTAKAPYAILDKAFSTEVRPLENQPDSERYPNWKDLGKFKINSISADKYGTVSVVLHNDEFDIAINVASKSELMEEFEDLRLTDIVRLLVVIE